MINILHQAVVVKLILILDRIWIMSIISDSDLNSRQELLNLDIADVSTTELVPNINVLVNLTECLSESLLHGTYYLVT